ncbi:FtsX-like permease family protein [Microbacterium sp. BLY]|uniref:FtsX-like permease family protein n=1 Tax=Microbacterium sp. BLY TaxID=2823280 RepID=UPI001B32B492|nr:FtsX-like permease family protein [Microbacterium sp. BLY]MBP3976390.1 hypothetical protein [Microbacterium sp. BLY]
MTALAASGRMILARIRRNPLSSVSLVLLIAISAATAGAGVATLQSAVGETERLFADAAGPDAVQMHVGAVDPQALDAFAAQHPDLVEDHQTQVALQLDNLDLRLQGTSDAARDGVMDLLLVTQNPRFDFLVDADGAPARVGEGEIGVPTYYAEAYDLVPGDELAIVAQGEARTFTVSQIVRDAQMGPGLVNSKRLLLSASDWAQLAEVLPTEHILTFRLAEGAADRFADAYRLADLPANGAAVDGSLLRLIAGLTGGLVAALGIVVSLGLLAIALLCLRIMVLTALEQDARRLGVLRAIGFSHREVSRTLLGGYAAHAAVALLIAGAAALPLAALLRPGDAPPATPSPAALAAPAVAVVVAGAIPVLFAALVLRRVRRISPLVALTRPAIARRRPRRLRPLRWDLPVPLGVRLAVRELTARKATSVLLVAMVGFAVALAGLPQRMTQTMEAPEFVTTMGVGQSDLRAFLRGGGEEGAGADLTRALNDDPDVDRLATTTSFRMTLVTATGAEAIALEVGDTSVFPVTYVRGGAPAEGDIALSTLAAQNAAADIGEIVEVGPAGDTRPLRLSGIYNDITNGGRSGKTVAWTGDHGTPLWETVMLDLRAGVDPTVKAAELARAHPAASFTDVERFVRFTLGDTIRALSVAASVAGAAAAAVLLLVFALRGQLEAARDASDRRLRRTLGATAAEIRAVVLIRAAGIAGAGLLVGVVVTESLGPAVLGLGLASVGGGTTALAAASPAALLAPAAVAAAAVLGSALAALPRPALLDES